ncbi:MAG: hypothetical protein RBS72_04250 [Sedimentisphaerales bacterium]|jgi:hypothetical protein|nr:hypothetical protein [Sedimentisphaerales bacterium]HNY77568.1 hypothetical protein [Sedimentisphaerales bacterium]HOC61901.1 hypothetical protein [Sedimentisphaerales bacterium]HOH63743.1 hypothetical protein [Sedimentisphaerales bacterium]HPY48352.1 hypothetical protein [Sedimentisphaerales bacterium]
MRRIVQQIAFVAACLLAAAPATAQRILYVDDDALPLGDGASWTNAYRFLQDALADAASAGEPVEVRVAQGLYKPDQGTNLTLGNREATFQLVNGVALTGGYAGLSAADPDARDVALHETILSGDLAGNDADVNDLKALFREPTRAENSYHVVTGSRTDETAVLDGMTITAGNADAEYFDLAPHSTGGGVYNEQGSPVVVNCTFKHNASYDGGAVYNIKSQPTFMNCRFTANMAQLYAPTDIVFGGCGAGIHNDRSHATITDCTFQGNYANGGAGVFNYNGSNAIVTRCTFVANVAWFGGGIYNLEGSSPTLLDCTFRNNSSLTGGAASNRFESSPILTNCLFEGNQANGDGGAIDNHWYSNPNLTNCTFDANRAKRGGGMRNGSNTKPILKNCVFTGNIASSEGGAMDNFFGAPILTQCSLIANSAGTSGGAISNNVSAPTLTNCTLYGNLATEHGGGIYSSSSNGNSIVTNCILWANQKEQIRGKADVSYSDVQGGFDGVGNISAGPLFADPANGDYHLKSQAGRWDPNSANWVADDVTSPCIDAGDPNSPIGDEPEPNGGIINMGAYGGTAEASKSGSDVGTTLD